MLVQLDAVSEPVPRGTSPPRSSRPCWTRYPPGSYLAASHGTTGHDRAGAADTVRAFREARIPFYLRDSDDFARLAFSGLELVPPGVVLVSEWRPEDTRPRSRPAEVGNYDGVDRKP
jgi:hypothetical protein